jgi:hypothetical protein
VFETRMNVVAEKLLLHSGKKWLWRFVIPGLTGVFVISILFGRRSASRIRPARPFRRGARPLQGKNEHARSPVPSAAQAIEAERIRWRWERCRQASSSGGRT